MMLAFLADALPVAGVVGGSVTATALIGFGVKKFFDAVKKRDQERDGKEASDKAESAQWREIKGLRKDFDQHRVDDAQSFAALETKVDLQGITMTEISRDVKTLLRRDTRRIDRDG